MSFIKLRISKFALFFMLLNSTSKASIFGEENIPLAKLVVGQIEEIAQLAEQINVAKDQVEYLRKLNDGIENVISQIQSIQSIVDRAKDLNPSSIKSISDLNQLLRRAKGLKLQIEDMMLIRTQLAGIAIEQSSLQSDTSYKMGQEMIKVGSDLAVESKHANPGRAAQITAASSSAQMLAQGVQLQSLSHLIQLQAMSLEFQRSKVESEAKNKNAEKVIFTSELLNSLKGKK